MAVKCRSGSQMAANPASSAKRATSMMNWYFSQAESPSSPPKKNMPKPSVFFGAGGGGGAGGTPAAAAPTFRPVQAWRMNAMQSACGLAASASDQPAGIVL